MECRRGLAMRILSVCLSVCPSVKRVHGDKTEERSVQIFIPYETSFSLVFWEEEWLLGATPSTWNCGSTGLKNAKRPFISCKIALRLKKVCYRVFLCENYQRQSRKAFIGITIRAKMIGGGRSLLCENLVDDDSPVCNAPIFDLFFP